MPKDCIEGYVSSYIPDMDKLEAWLRKRGFGQHNSEPIRVKRVGNSVQAIIVIGRSHFRMLFSNDGCRYWLEPLNTVNFENRPAAKTYAHVFTDKIITNYSKQTFSKSRPAST